MAVLNFNKAIYCRMEINFNLETPDGKPAEALAKIIEARRKELGETTRQSCVAVASNILRSLRAQTKVAKENQMDISITLADSKYYPSFKRDKGAKGKRVSERVLRQGKNGPVITPEKVVWRVGKYVKGEVIHSFEVVDKVSDQKEVKYIMVAKSEKDAMKYAKQFHKGRVKRHKYLAKHAIGLAMKAIYDKGGANDKVNQDVRDLARQNVDTSVRETGFNSGEVNIHIHDKLDYAALALQNGQSSVNLAIQNAVNKIFGMIKQKLKQNGGSIDESLKMSVDELNRGGLV